MVLDCVFQEVYRLHPLRYMSNTVFIYIPPRSLSANTYIRVKIYTRPNFMIICYPKGFLSSGSYGLLSHKFGVHHHPVFRMSGTLGEIIALLTLIPYALR